jgi:hypothetical protein
MSASVTGKLSALNGSTDAIRRPSPHASSGGDTVRSVSAAKRSRAEARDRDAGIIIDLQPDPPEEAAHGAIRRDFERAGQTSRLRSVETVAPSDGVEWTYRANRDNPYQRRTFQQTYEAIEALDAPVSRRGRIFDLRV